MRDGGSRGCLGLLAAVAMAACGARTGLWIDVATDGGSDAEQDALPPLDSGPGDVAVEATLDGNFDAAPDSAVDGPAAEAGDAGEGGEGGEAGHACDGPCPCPPGTMAVGSSCMPIVGAIPAPRPVSPLSTARATSAFPSLAWQLPAGTDGAVVQLCADRACAKINQTFLATTTSGTPPAPLPVGVSFWRLLGASGGSVGVTTSATWELFVPAHASTSVRTWWGSTLDVDGDGLADVGVGALTLNSYEGAASLYAGQRGTGPSAMPVELDGPAPADEYGCGIGSAGDVNGDGFGDLFVGQCDLDQGVAGGAPSAYVYLGGPSGIAASGTPLPFAYGYSGGTAGDVNADGYGDLVVGSLGGSAYVYLGGPTGIGTTPAPLGAATALAAGTAFGSADVNGDAWPDLVVGSSEVNGRDGAAGVYFGTPAGLSATWVPLSGPPAGNQAGFGSTIGVGDLDDDGYADVLVGAYLYAGEAGQAYLFRGGPGGLDSPPAVLGDPRGGSGGRYSAGLSGVHDVNGDGFEDFVVGAFLDSGDIGAAWLYLGSASGLQMPIPLVNPSAARTYFGEGVAGGDLDGDGYADVVVGASGINAAYWYRGSAGGLLAPTPLVNPHPGAMGLFGLAVGM